MILNKFSVIATFISLRALVVKNQVFIIQGNIINGKFDTS